MRRNTPATVFSQVGKFSTFSFFNTCGTGFMVTVWLNSVMQISKIMLKLAASSCFKTLTLADRVLWGHHCLLGHVSLFIRVREKNLTRVPSDVCVGTGHGHVLNTTKFIENAVVFRTADTGGYGLPYFLMKSSIELYEWVICVPDIYMTSLSELRIVVCQGWPGGG